MEASKEARLVAAADVGVVAYYKESGFAKALGTLLVAALLFAYAHARLGRQDYLLGSLAVFLALFVLSTLVSITPWGTRNRARNEAKALRRAGKKLLKKHGHKLSATASAALETALARVDEALKDRAALPSVQARAELDLALDEHLAFARKSAAREYTESIGGAILVALLLRAFVFEPFHIPSGSMIPTLLVGDFIFVNKMSYGLRIPFTDPARVHKLFESGPKRGDVVVFMVPKSPEVDYVKRVIGLPGDRIDVQDNQVWVNGILQNHVETGEYVYTEHSEYTDAELETRAREYTEDLAGVKHRMITRQDPAYSRNGHFLVEPGRAFMMGDNRDNSADSRVEGGIGQIPFSYMKGRASLIWVSFGGQRGVRFERMFQWVK